MKRPYHKAEMRPRWMVRWCSPRDGTLREEKFIYRKDGLERIQKLKRGHIESDLWDCSQQTPFCK